MYRANLTPSKLNFLKTQNGHKKIGGIFHGFKKALPDGTIFWKEKSVGPNLQSVFVKNVENNGFFLKKELLKSRKVQLIGSGSVQELLTARKVQFIGNSDVQEPLISRNVLLNVNHTEQILTDYFSKMQHLTNSANDIESLYEIFPQPLDSLNGIYSKVSSKFDDDKHDIQQIFTQKRISRGITHWDCTYHIKWPMERSFSMVAETKRLAASQCALKVLQYLKQSGSISDNNSPIFKNMGYVAELPKSADLRGKLMKNKRHAAESPKRGLNPADLRYKLIKKRMEESRILSEVNTNVQEDLTDNSSPRILAETPALTFLPPKEEFPDILTPKEFAVLSEKFSDSTSVLYNFYNTVSELHKNPGFKLKPSFLYKKVNNNGEWECTYNLQWPKHLTFVDSGVSPHIASSKCAEQILNYLSENKYLTKDLILQTKIIAEKLTSHNSLLEGSSPIEDSQIKSKCKKLRNVKVISTKVPDHFTKNSIVGNNLQIRLLAKQLCNVRAYSTETNHQHEALTNADMKKLHKLFPNPKNILHSVFDVVSKELNNRNCKLSPLYTKTKVGGIDKWECTYHLKWPVDVKFTEISRTKQEASTKAALSALNFLKLEGKLTKQKQPVLYDSEEVVKQKLKTLKLHPKAMKTMKDIVDCYKSEFVPLLVDSVDGETEDVVMKDSEADWSSIKEVSVRRFRDEEFYACKEVVKLPISDFKTKIMEIVKDNRVVVVKGEPGCGKSTRVPQYILESWAKSDRLLRKDCKIVVTQPRRIAAISLAERVSNERNEGVGLTAGYQVRLKSSFNHRTGHILYCTTGILLRRLQSDPNLTDYTHVIIDEAHERDVNTDLLLNLLRIAVQTNPKLKLIIMSATIDAEKFKEYFESAALIHIPGFTYPVKINFLDAKNNLPKTMEMCSRENPEVVCEDVAKLIRFIHKDRAEGAILCFLPGWGEISKVNKMFQMSSGDLAVYCLHSRMQDSEQRLIFSKPPPGVRKVILATNIAETSVTIDDVVYVIDTGIQKDQRFDVERGISCIDNRWIAKSSMAQRKGRAGRVQSGESFHLYPEKKFETFDEYSTPEILRTSLTKIVLDCKVYSNNAKATEFLSQLLNPPETTAILKAVDELKELELLDENENLTPLGRVISDFQLEPNLGKAMVNSVLFKCVTPIVDIVTMFSAESELFVGGLTAKEDVNKCKSQFSKSSDHLAMMRILEKWLEYIDNEEMGMAQYFCRDNNLIEYKLNTIRQLRGIHFEYLNKGLLDILPKSDDFSDNDELVKGILLSGVGHVLQHRNFDIVKGRIKKGNVLLTRNNHKATISSDSVNHRRSAYPTNFLLYINETRSDIRRTTTVRETSLISPLSVFLFKNNKLLIEKVPEKYLDDDQNKDDYVLLKLENTNIECICDKMQAEIVKECKESLVSGMQYYIFQLTKGGQYDDKINSIWDNILRQLDEVLMLQGVDSR